MAVAIIKEALMKYKFEGSTVYCCFLDLSKAFERVKHDRLIDKLYTRNVPTYLISIIKNIFSGSSVSVLYEGEYSESWNLVRGVRQGGIISAYLFNLYIDDILTSISKTQVGCKLGLSLLSVQAYADDMILMSPTSSGLQRLLNVTSRLLDEEGLVLNVQKTNIVVFNQKSRQPANLRFYYDGHIISIVDSFKYLGCILSGDLTDVLDIDRCNKAFNKSAGFLLRKFNNADNQIFLHLFNSFCSTLYGCELWIDRKGCARALKEFSVSYHAVLKKILNVPRYFSNHYVCGILSLFTFEHFINIKLTRFMLWIKIVKAIASIDISTIFCIIQFL